MDGLKFRPLLESDSAAVLEVLVAAEAAEPSESFVDLTEVELELRQPGMNLPQGSLAALHNGRIVGFATLYAPGPGTEWNVYLSGAVLPEYRRAGIGGSLLQYLIDQAKILRDRDFSDLPGILKIWLQAGRTSAAALAAAADFTVRRYFFEMRAGLEEPLVDWAALATVNSPRLEGIEVRGWSADDDEGVRLAYNQAFADHWGSVSATPERWRDMFAQSPFFRPDCSRIAVLNAEVVGFVLVDEFDSETAAHGYRTGYIDRVGTVRAIRGRGLAKVLLAQSMVALASSGCRYAELGVDADSPTGAGRLYESLGFAVLRRNRVTGLDF